MIPASTLAGKLKREQYPSNRKKNLLSAMLLFANSDVFQKTVKSQFYYGTSFDCHVEDKTNN